MKQGNACGEKGLAVMRESSGETSASLRGGNQVATKLLSLTQRARRDPKCRFTSLIHLLSEEFLAGCFRELKRGKSPGIDEMTVEEYESKLEENLKELVARMKAWQYRPKPVKRVYIPKPNGKKRPLGIPAVEDKIVQMGIKKILEAIYEVDFLDISYGFRPKRSCHDALDEIDKAVMTKPVNYVVDTDIATFFDTVDHKWLMKCLRQRIADPNLLRLIGRLLRAGIMEEGKYIEVDKGTPQGGVLSPLLANIYLHYILDLWFETEIKNKVRGFAQLTRYADDFIICLQSERDARIVKEALEERLSKFELSIAEDKSKVIKFGRREWHKARSRGERTERFDFLGITHYCERTRAGNLTLGRKTARKKQRQKLKAMNQWMKHIRNRERLEEWWARLARKLTGHYRYYGIGGNYRAPWIYRGEVIELAYKWINRRSQKRSYNWTKFNRFMEFNPLPKPKIYHPYPSLV
jgi:group II intron reverse transcriptase/maturase